MKIEMKILSRIYNDDEFDIVVTELKKQGWNLKRQYGGKMPNYTGHGAELEKVCFSSYKQLQKKKDTDVKQLPIHGVSQQSEQLSDFMRYLLEKGYLNTKNLKDYIVQDYLISLNCG